MSEQDDLVADALAEVVPLGDMPTQREIELGQAVARQIAERRAREEHDDG
jgi:hypothetical protein